jgi:DNA-binding transcriptional ArsR family regulator
MRSRAPDLLPIFRSRHQADLLAWLYLHPDQEYTTTELAARFDVALTTLHREVQRLVKAGLIRDRTVGRSRLLRAAAGHRAAAPLTQLLMLSFGPPTVIEETFANVEGIQAIYIYGSWAARYAGVPGPSPGDVDVLVIGTVSRADVYAASDAAQDRLGYQVNPTIRTLEQWTHVCDNLVRQIKTAPTVTVRDFHDSDSEGDPN